MKGTLVKTEQGWMVDYPQTYNNGRLPLNPDDVKICKQYNEWLGDYSVDWNGKEVEFEIEYLSSLLSQPYAKLVRPLDLPKMEQKLDEALSNETSESLTDWIESKREDDVEKLIDEITKDLKDVMIKETAKMCLKSGYSLAKKNLYTEEDMHKAYCAGSNFDMSCLKNEQYYMFKNWFEQFKK